MHVTKKKMMTRV